MYVFGLCAPTFDFGCLVGKGTCVGKAGVTRDQDVFPRILAFTRELLDRFWEIWTRLACKVLVSFCPSAAYVRQQTSWSMLMFLGQGARWIALRSAGRSVRIGRRRCCLSGVAPRLLRRPHTGRGGRLNAGARAHAQIGVWGRAPRTKVVTQRPNVRGQVGAGARRFEKR